ncbi:MAG: hypothetical protein II904_02750 [Oscillospiraceae bacterium]|nr:hypothetical protein [Oscillospiraceae bacterium]
MEWHYNDIILMRRSANHVPPGTIHAARQIMRLWRNSSWAVVVAAALFRAAERQRHPAKNERLVEPVPLGYMSSLFSDFMGSRLRARNLRCYFDNLKKIASRMGSDFLR